MTILPLEGENKNWLMIELQGEIQSKGAADEPKDGKILGKLINHSSDLPVLIIGNSKLEGKRMKLAKPFALLKKVGNGYETKGIVSEKLLFKTRPKPLSQ